MCGLIPFFLQYWTDQQQAVKKKAQKLSDFVSRGTGGGPPLQPLDDYENRVMSCIGGTKRVFGYTQVNDPLMVSCFSSLRGVVSYFQETSPHLLSTGPSNYRCSPSSEEPSQRKQCEEPILLQ